MTPPESLETPQDSPPTHESSPVRRRQFLRQVLQATAVTGAGLIGVKLIGGLGNRSQPSTFAPELTNLSLPLPDHLLTPIPEFYIQSYAAAPILKAEDWQLEIKGAVTQPLTLTYADILQATPQEDFYLTMECIGNPAGGNLIGNARWTGTPLRPFLDKAGIDPAATQFILHGADSYETTLPVNDVMRSEVRLVHRMNGAPLTPEHGYPVRIILPGHFGQKQPKWIVGIEATTREKRGYWERQGWSNTANIPTHALTRQLQNERVWHRHAEVSFSRTGDTGWDQGILIAGVALDGYSPIRQVWVSTNNGETWQQAEQNAPASPHEWTLWRYLWQPDRPGDYTVLARAVSTTAEQPLEDNNFRDGSTAAFKIRVSLQG